MHDVLLTTAQQGPDAKCMQIDNTIFLDFDYSVWNSHVLGRGGTSSFWCATDSVTLFSTISACEHVTASMTLAPQMMRQIDAMTFCSA